MKMPSNYASKFIRITSFIFLVLLALYALVGFLLAPIIAKHFAQKAISEHTRWSPFIEDIKFNPFDLRLHIQQFALLAPEDQQGIKQKEIGFSHLNVDLNAQELIASLFTNDLSIIVSDIKLVAPFVDVKLNKDGTLNLSERVISADSQQEESEDTSSNPIKWHLDKIALIGGRVNFSDHQPVAPFELTIEDINFSLANLSHILSNDSPYELDFSIEQAPVTLKGTLSPSPLASSGNIKIADLNLPLVQSYLSDLTHLAIDEGKLSVNSQYDIQQTQELAGDITIDSKISSLSISDTRVDKALFSFDEFSLASSDISFPALNVALGAIDLNGPQIDLRRDKQGNLALADVMKKSEETILADSSAKEHSEESGKSEESLQSQEPGQSAPTSFNVASVNIKQGLVSISDNSVSPVFENKIDQISLSVGQIDGKSPSSIQLSMGLLSNASLDIQGELAPIESGKTELGIGLKNLALSELSAYTQHLTGYPISEGQLNLDLKYLIDEQQLDAKHQILIDHLDFADKSNKDPVVSAPLPMLVAMLEDNSQLINLNIPVGGDLSDPTVNVFSLLIDGLQAFFTKLITSPFSMLGKIVGFEGDISWVEFEAGKAELSPEQSYRLQQLARLLNERPRLALTIQPAYHSTTDLNAIRELQGAEISEPIKELEILAKSRASYLRDFLINQSGISESRVRIDEKMHIAKGSKAIRSTFEITPL